jgi:hypothetical protein
MSETVSVRVAVCTHIETAGSRPPVHEPDGRIPT